MIFEISHKLPSVERVVVVPLLINEQQLRRSALPDVTAAVSVWGDFLASAPEQPLKFEQLPFDHPLYILYSSGTTGAPKCIVHGAGGTLLQHAKEHQLHTDLRPGSVLLYFTTCGWMMWNWLVSALFSGSTVVLYDGSPTWPSPTRMFDIVDNHEINVLGASARFFSAIEKAGLQPIRSHNLQSLQTILSTGSPLLPESFEYIYSQVKNDVCLSSISGGTDIVSCFALGNPTLPVYSGQLQCPGLGMDVDVVDPAGKSLQGEKGELVCKQPFPSAPIGFWHDETGQRYHQAYFSRFPGIWAHGDYAELTAQGGMVIYGRSDAVLNPGGVRIGTAEIYRQVALVDAVLESLVVGQQWQGDERLILFVILREGHRLDDALCEQIKQTVRQHASPRHVPAKIIEVTDLPRTLSGKLVELAVRDVIHGRPVTNRDALANPQSLSQFVALAELNT